MSEGNKNRLIYKNTIIIYIRMLFVTFVGLFSSRFILQALGASDYGLFNVVGGMIALFNILASAMSTTSRRYINIEMGNPNGNLNRIFNICLLLHIGFALLLLLVAETIGIWYINNILNVAEGKLGDAMFVFQISTIVACLGIINIPYQSLIEANEQFGKSAAIDMVTTTIRLGLVIALLYYPGNALRFFSIITCVLSLTSFSLYHIICYRSWPSVIKHRFYRDASKYKEMLVFNNYIALGAAASLGKTQGSNMIVNFFFGTVVNAAFAVAYQVENYVYMFVNKLTQASNPQVTINYSRENMSRVYELVERNSRICILIMTLFFFPFIAEVDTILALWLKVVPEGTELLCTLTLIQGLVTSFSEGTNGYIQASGRIKWFFITNSTLTILNLPLGYLLFKLGFEAYWIVVCFILTSLLTRINSLWLMQKLLKFDVWHYIRNAYLPPLSVIIIMTILIVAYRQLELSTLASHLIGLLIIVLITAFLVFGMGLTVSERRSLNEYARNKLFKRV